MLQMKLLVLMIIGLCSEWVPYNAWADAKPVYGLGIESMRSHGYSVGIFVFVMVSIAVFVGIMIGFYRKDRDVKVKTGEKFLFGMIGFGVLVAAGLAALQLLDGFLL